MTIFDCNFVPIDVRNNPEFMSESILSITNYKKGLLFSSYATASVIKKYSTLGIGQRSIHKGNTISNRKSHRLTKELHDTIRHQYKNPCDP